jgi:hypothetical protein
MANKKINQLVSKTAILSTDIFGIGDATTGQLFKKTIAELQAAIGGAVISVNGLVGTVVLDTDDIQELATPTNKYFTDARARGAISLTVTGNSGASTYSSGTGVLNVPTYTLAGLGGITATFLSGTSGISYNSTTGVISYSGTVYTDASIRALFSGATGISYNSSTGAISYSGTVYTDSSIRALISLTTTGTSGASTYNNTTGVINVPNYTLAGLGGISLTSLSGGTGITYNNTTGAISYSGTVYTDASVRALISASGAVSYNNTTGVISLTSGNLTEATSSVLTITGGTGAVLGSGTSIQVKQASTTVSGFLSSTDWNTFNGKANALSGTTNYVAKFTSSSAIGNSLLYSDSVGVGINIINPNYSLQVNSSTTSNRIQLTNTSSGTASADGLQIGQSGLDAYISNREAGAFDIETSGVTRLSIASTGAATFSSTVLVNSTLSAYLGTISSGNTPATSGTTPVNAMLNLTNNRGIGMYFGGKYSGDYAQWIQVSDTGNLSVNYPLLLNPNGGNVGIGTSSPLSRLDINNTYVSDTTTQVIIRDNTGGGLHMGGTGGAARWLQAQDYTGAATYYSLLLNPRGGNILLGTTTNNGERLYVSGDIRATGSITANSDLTLKKNLLKIENALEKVEQINGYTYEFREDDSKRHAGVVAQEIQVVLPEIVNKGNDGILGVEYGNISALLIEAIKEQNTKIKNLETLLASK